MADCKLAFCDNIVEVPRTMDDILLKPCDSTNFLVTHDGHDCNDEEPMAFVEHKFAQIGRGFVCRTQEWVARRQKSTAVGKHTQEAHVDMMMNV